MQAGKRVADGCHLLPDDDLSRTPERRGATPEASRLGRSGVESGTRRSSPASSSSAPSGRRTDIFMLWRGWSRARAGGHGDAEGLAGTDFVAAAISLQAGLSCSTSRCMNRWHYPLVGERWSLVIFSFFKILLKSFINLTRVTYKLCFSSAKNQVKTKF